MRRLLTFATAFLLFASARSAVALQSCGDCDGNGTVTIGEVVQSVNNFLGQSLPQVCPSGLTNCSGVCRDLLHDNTNCGACGTVCPAGDACSSGACQWVCAQPGALNESDLPAEADFCNVQFPSSFSVQQGQSTSVIFGRIFEAGVTEAAGPNPNVRAEVGFGPTATDPRTAAGWTFFAATYNTQIADDDEYQGSFPAPLVGTFSYVFRFSFDGGLNYTYCDLDGAGSNAGLSFDTTQLGVMTVTP